MSDVFSLIRLLATLAVAAGIVYGIYLGIRWRFPRLGRRRAILIVSLGTIVLASFAFSTLRIGGVECLQHENIVLLRGERKLQIRKDIEVAPQPMTEQRYARVLDSCQFLEAHCPFDSSDKTRAAARDICLKAQAGHAIH
jgi:hypothetical protein